MKLGALDATVHTSTASRYQVQGYPTIKFFPAGKKSSSSLEDYNGGRTSSDIVNWAQEKLTENVPAPEVLQVSGFFNTLEKKTYTRYSLPEKSTSAGILAQVGRLSQRMWVSI